MPDRRRALIAQAMDGKPTKFLTYTIPHIPGMTNDQAARKLCDARRIMYKRALREAQRDPQKHPLPFGAPPPRGWKVEPGKSLPPMVVLENGRWPYLCVMEKTKAGWPHIHELARLPWISVTWLRAQMIDLVGAPQCRVENIDDQGRAAAYIAKYCGKAVEKFKTSKRYWQTRDYQLSKEFTDRPVIEQGGRWEREPMPLHKWCTVFTELGWQVERLSDRHALARAPP